jgi:hypothetical protein
MRGVVQLVRTLPCHRPPVKNRSGSRCFLEEFSLTFAQPASPKLERLPVTQEAAGSSPVAPANSSTVTLYLLSKGIAAALLPHYRLTGHRVIGDLWTMVYLWLLVETNPAGHSERAWP